MDEFHRHPAHEVVLGGVAAAACRRSQREEGPQPLAARGDEVGRHLVEEAVARDDRGGEQGFQTPQSLLEAGQVKGLCRIHCSKR